MFIDELFNVSNIWISLHLKPLLKSKPLKFDSSKFCLHFDSLLGWLSSQGFSLAKIDQRKQYFSLFSMFNIADYPNGTFTYFELSNSIVCHKKYIVIEVILSNLQRLSLASCFWICCSNWDLRSV